MRLSCVVPLAALLSLSVDGYAQCNPCVSAGAKLSHTFGADGGFTWGFEVSGTQWDFEDRAEGMYGFVISWDMTGARGRARLHLGIEAGFVFSGLFSAGIDVGPTFVFSTGRTSESGIGVAPFAGAFTVFPFYAFVIGTIDPMQEIGLIAKFPIVFDPVW